jgi:ABC-type sugar transport system substrate-binding protein
MADKYQSHSDNLISSARDAFAITPNDSTDLVDIPKALYVGAAGSLVVTLVDDAASVTFVAVPAGALLPIRPRRVHASGTTAGSILGLA